jgi:hypothetical protein
MRCLRPKGGMLSAIRAALPMKFCDLWPKSASWPKKVSKKMPRKKFDKARGLRGKAIEFFEILQHRIRHTRLNRVADHPP